MDSPASALRPHRARRSSALSDRSYTSSHYPASSALSPSSSAHSLRNRSTPSRRQPSKSSLLSRPSSPSSGLLASSPVGRLISYLSTVGRLELVLPVILLAAGVSKWACGLGSHSGFQNPPMYGDFEAQRHWLEITRHLPVGQWYWCDLPYWGLDYPPLTAFHSLVLGHLAHSLDPSWVALDLSRGHETPGLRAFMRGAGLVGEVGVWWSACWAWVWWDRAGGSKRSRREKLFLFYLLISQPTLTIVDTAHFQFNSLMLGLALWSFVLMRLDRDGWAAVAFVASLGFKQIALYWSPAVGVWLVAKCWNLGRSQGTQLFLKLAFVTSLSFAALLAPFAFAGWNDAGWQGTVRQVVQVGARVFPFARGIFEDKVANFWCATNVVVKWRLLVPLSYLPPLALGLTALALLPSSFYVLHLAHVLPSGAFGGREERGGRAGEIVGELVEHASLGFFLCAFQVHEKAILLPLLGSMMALTAPSNVLSREQIRWAVLYQTVGMFSMWPLLKRDGVALQYVVLTGAWAWSVGGWSFAGAEEKKEGRSREYKWISTIVYSLMAVLHLAEWYLPPPPSKPDLYAVLNVLGCFAFFSGRWAVSLAGLVKKGWGMQALGQ